MVPALFVDFFETNEEAKLRWKANQDVKAKLKKQKTLNLGKDIDSALTNEPVVRPENL
jgi:hypothetical protein